jgi:hypothetical protein
MQKYVMPRPRSQERKRNLEAVQKRDVESASSNVEKKRKSARQFAQSLKQYQNLVVN